MFSWLHIIKTFSEIRLSAIVVHWLSGGSAAEEFWVYIWSLKFPLSCRVKLFYEMYDFYYRWILEPFISTVCNEPACLENRILRALSSDVQDSLFCPLLSLGVPFFMQQEKKKWSNLFIFMILSVSVAFFHFYPINICNRVQQHLHVVYHYRWIEAEYVIVVKTVK